MEQHITSAPRAISRPSRAFAPGMSVAYRFAARRPYRANAREEEQSPAFDALLAEAEAVQDRVDLHSSNVGWASGLWAKLQAGRHWLGGNR